MICDFFDDFIFSLFISLCGAREVLHVLAFKGARTTTRDDKLKNNVHGRLVSVRVKEHNIILYVSIRGRQQLIMREIQKTVVFEMQDCC